ncbi:hypothetical protein J2S55_007219 [Streptosporangium brasiliense]|uniref:Uncharacterized protein n=1 Tax=Streptosporangium brasiliense TaxID=47480 RepID=A0ABT9RFQ1_9ACTN|nr:hypothetical protein [Streptosporangium brasiliense]
MRAIVVKGSEEAIATAVSLLAGASGAVTGAGDAALRAPAKLDRVLPARLPWRWR